MNNNFWATLSTDFARRTALIAMTWFSLLLLPGGTSIASAQDFDVGASHFKAGAYGEALQHFQPLAENGHRDAQVMLGGMYELGYGVDRDYGKAVEWYRKSSVQGLAQAQTLLGVMYTGGAGVTQDFQTAYMWFTAAIRGGYGPATEVRENLADHMTSESIAAALERADVCIASGYSDCD